MNLSQVVELYEYDCWANEELLSIIEGIEFERLIQNVESSFGSIRDTLVHILGAEELWLSRWNGQAIRGLLDPNNFGNYVVLKNRWALHSSKLMKYLSDINDEKLMKPLSYTNIQGINYTTELWKQMLHVVNHSSYHRGQVVTMMRQLSIQPPSLDLIYYYVRKQ